MLTLLSIHYNNPIYQSAIVSPKNMAIAMPMHKNGPNANWLFRFAFFGEQQRTEAAAEQNADKRGNDRQLCAEEKPAPNISLISPPPKPPGTMSAKAASVR